MDFELTARNPCTRSADTSPSRPPPHSSDPASTLSLTQALPEDPQGGQTVISVAVAPIAKELRGKVTELQASRRLEVRVGGRTYSAILTPDLAAGGYSIEVPELPGVVTEADSIPEARKMIADAVRLWLSATRPTRKRTG